MPRMTAKYSEAVKTGKKLKLPKSCLDNRESLYAELLKAGLNWDGKEKTWSENNPWLGSSFEDAHGKPTGHIKLRVMAHPKEILEVIEIIQEALAEHSVSISPTSEKVYENRKGVGVRAYMEGTIS